METRAPDDAPAPPTGPNGDPPAGDPIRFRKMPAAQWAQLDPDLKESAVKARHVGILRASAGAVYAALQAVLRSDGAVMEAPANDADPAAAAARRPPPALADLVVALVHRDDPFAPAELAEALDRQRLEVAVLLGRREEWAARLASYEPEAGQPGTGGAPHVRRPYLPAARELRRPPPDGAVWVAVFDTGMVSLVPVPFDPTAGPPLAQGAAPSADDDEQDAALDPPPAAALADTVPDGGDGPDSLPPAG